MALILSIETSSNGCSAALHTSGKLLSSFELFAERSSAEMLTTLIEDILKVAKKAFEDLDAIAVSKGPGSYTGLRIGVSTVKGICYAADLPLISINSLDTMIAQVPGYYKGLICPMLDARRMEVYCKLMETAGKEIMPTTAKIIDATAFEEYLENKSVLFCGEGAEKCKEVITSTNAIFVGNNIRPRASFMGVLAFAKWEASDFENVSDFEPYYLKEFVGTTPKKNKKVTA